MENSRVAQVQQKLYVLSTPNKKQKAPNDRILKYVNNNLPKLLEMGVRVTVVRVTPSQVANRKVQQKLAQAGIRTFPTLVTDRGVYPGAQKIIDLYAAYYKQYETWRQQQLSQLSSPELDLADYYGREMTFDKASTDREEDMDDTAMHDPRQMMRNFDHMLEEREKRRQQMDPQHRRASRPPSDPGDASPAAAVAGRGDNVGGDEPSTERNEDIDRILGQLEGGGSGLDGDTPMGGDSQMDDVMARAYWENQEMST